MERGKEETSELDEFSKTVICTITAAPELLQRESQNMVSPMEGTESQLRVLTSHAQEP